MSVSLDGYVAPADGSGDWIAAGGSHDAMSRLVETVSKAGAHLMGATSADWGETTIVAGDLAEAIARLKKERFGGYLLARGGARFARSLAATGLIDEYRLLVHPGILTRGERTFPAPQP